MVRRCLARLDEEGIPGELDMLRVLCDTRAGRDAGPRLARRRQGRLECRDPVSWMMIEQGWSVVDSDGEDVGRIDEVLGDEDADIFNGLQVLTGALGKQTYVPAERVGEIVEGRVQLELTKDELG